LTNTTLLTSKVVNYSNYRKGMYQIGNGLNIQSTHKKANKTGQNYNEKKGPED
jgi:hypothetical protein